MFAGGGGAVVACVQLLDGVNCIQLVLSMFDAAARLSGDRCMRGRSLVLVIILLAGTAGAEWTWTPETGRWVNAKRLPKETAELQVEYARSLMLEGKYKQAMEETSKFSKFFPTSDAADDNQFLRGEIRMKQQNYKSASKEFQQVLKNYPDTDLYQQAIANQYVIGDHFYEEGQKKMNKKWALLKKRPLKRASEVYGMVIENQPFTPEAAQAQYKVGLCHYAREEYTEAAFEYRRVIEDYAGSEFVDDAGFGLAMCYYDGSRPPDYDQTNSELAVRAIDDFTSQFPTDGRTAELDTKRAEMRARMAEGQLRSAAFYVKRREFLSARIYYELIAKDFADTPAATKANEWLAANPGAPKMRGTVEAQ